MKIVPTNLLDCIIIDPLIFKDHRGYFLESFNQKTFDQLLGQEVCFVQDNESLSTRGVLRGLHYQEGAFSQAKLVRVVLGEVLDVVVDIRPDSPTYLQHETIKLSAENKRQLFVPKGFAHGFVVLSETAIFSYKCDNFYNKASERGIIYNDSSLQIDWQLPHEDLIISDRDLALPKLDKKILIKNSFS